MMRTFRAALAVFLLSVVPASADTITFTIGELQWNDPFGLGPDITLLSYSDNPQFSTGPIPSDFVGGEFTDLTWTFSFADVGSTAFYGTPPGQLGAGSFAAFGTDPLNQVTLSFSFLYSLAGGALSQPYLLVFDQPAVDQDGEHRGSRLIDLSVTTQATSVPEPGSLMLLMTGLTLMAAVARRRTA